MRFDLTFSCSFLLSGTLDSIALGQLGHIVDVFGRLSGKAQVSFHEDARSYVPNESYE